MTRSDAVENRSLILSVVEEAIKSGRRPLPTMSDIVKTSGLGRGTVYRHFADIGELFFAYLQDGYTKLCCTYEPEWISGGRAVLRKRLQEFLTLYFKFNIENHSLLSSPECLTSEGLQLAKNELRRKIFVTATLMSDTPLKPIELSKWADVMAHCVETGHLMSCHILEARSEISVGIAMNLLDQFLELNEAPAAPG